MMEKPGKITESLAHGYSSEHTQREPSNEYQHDRVYMVFRKLCILVLWTRAASALEGLKGILPCTQSGALTALEHRYTY